VAQWQVSVLFILMPGQTGRRRHNVLDLSIRPSVTKLDVEYLRNSTRERHSYNGVLIGTYTRATERCNFKWPWVILSDLAKFAATLSVARPVCDSWASCLVHLYLARVRVETMGRWTWWWRRCSVSRWHCVCGTDSSRRRTRKSNSLRRAVSRACPATHRLFSSLAVEYWLVSELTFNGHIKTAQQRTIVQKYGDWYTGRW